MFGGFGLRAPACLNPPPFPFNSCFSLPVPKTHTDAQWSSSLQLYMLFHSALYWLELGNIGHIHVSTFFFYNLDLNSTLLILQRWYYINTMVLSYYPEKLDCIVLDIHRLLIIVKDAYDKCHWFYFCTLRYKTVPFIVTGVVPKFFTCLLSANVVIVYLKRERLITGV